MLQTVVCNLCGIDDTEVLINSKSSKIIRCKRCGLVYRNPRMSTENEVKQYAEKKYSDEYISNWGKLRRFDRQLSIIDQYTKKGKLLDIGCQFGEFIRMAAKVGWEAQGVDPSQQTAEICRKLKLPMFHGTLSQAEFSSESFDIVTMLLVLDQIPDPHGELLRVKRVLKKNGFLFIRVPNVTCHLFAHRAIRILKKSLSLDLNPTVFHIYGFSAVTLQQLLAKAGFKVLSIKNSKPTKADPYKTSGFLRSILVGFAKIGVYGLAQLLLLVSFKKLYMGTSIEAVAQRP